MRSIAAAALLFASCATAPAPKIETYTATPPPPPAPDCPRALPEKLLETGPVLGAKIEKVCLIGASEDAYLRLHEVVAPREGAVLTAAAVRADVEALFAPGTLHDVVAFAEVLPSKNVMLTYAVTEAPWVSRVDVTGTSRERADELKALAHEGLRATPYVLKTIASQVEAYIRGLGYAHATVKTTATPAGTGKATVALAIDEGPRVTVAALVIDGAKKVPKAELQKVLQQKTGEPYLEDQAERDALLLTGAYFDRGYINVRIDHETRPAKGDAVDVVLKVQEGEQYRLGALSLSGFSLGEAKDVLKVLESKPKGVFSRATLQRDLERLRERARQRGNLVNITPMTEVNADKKTVDVKFEVERTTGGGSVTF